MKNGEKNSDTDHAALAAALSQALAAMADIHFLSVNLETGLQGALQNAIATGITAPQNGMLWPGKDSGSLFRKKLMEKAAPALFAGSLSKNDAQWYDDGVSADVTRIFIPFSSKAAGRGILETGYHGTGQQVVTDRELRVIDAYVKACVRAFDLEQTARRYRREHHLLEALMRNIPDAIYFKDRQSCFMRASAALARKIGLADPADLIGKTDFDLFTDEHARQAFDDEQNIVETGNPEVDIIEKETWADSRITWVSTTKMPLYDDDGGIIGTFGISRDITARKEMEDALKFRLEFEEHITSSSSRFISLDLGAVDDAVRDVLGLIGRFLSSDRSFFILFEEMSDTIEKSIEWHAEDIESGERYHRRIREFTTFWSMLRGGEDVIVTHADAVDGGNPFRGIGVPDGCAATSFVWVPLVVAGVCGGVIGVEAVREAGTWADDTIALIKVIGEVFMNAMARKRSEEKLQNANNVLEQRVAERTEDLRNANELLRTHIDQLSFLNRSVYELSPLITVSALLPAILKVFMARFSGAQGYICLVSEEGMGTMYATELLQDDHCRIPLERIAGLVVDRKITGPEFVGDRTTDDAFGVIPVEGISPLRSMIAIPLLIDRVCRAVVTVFTGDYSPGAFSIEQSLLTTLAAHAAICLSNAFNAQERAEKARLDGELEAARSIQRRFTPHTRPDIPGISLKGVYYPANKVGGDYLDYFKTSRGDWVVVIADVCGKGIPAALFMTTMRSAFRILSEKETSAKALLCAVNGFMIQNIDERSFVTALCVIIAADGSTMTYARAGHPLLIRVGTRGGAPESVACSGVALGLMSDPELFSEMMQEKKIGLKPGDRYLLYTDGLVEATDRQKNAYGSGRLSTLLADAGDASPEDLVERIIADIRKFIGGAPDYDDLTLLVFRVN